MKNLIYLLTAVFALSVCNDAFAQRRNKNQEPKLKVKSSVMTSSWRFDGNITPSPAVRNNQGNTVSNAVTNNQPVAVPTSDVDRNIPTSDTKDPNMVALIIANENYSQAENVKFAHHDGDVFRKYCEETLGIDPRKIVYEKDVTLGTLDRIITKFKAYMGLSKGNVKAIVYYAGHGVPDKTSQKGYILPTDCKADQNGYSLEDLYRELATVPHKSITYFIDACFSGTKRDDGMLIASRGTAVKAQPSRLYGKSVVFSAATSDQTAFPYTQKGHGVFTYALLKALQTSEGRISYKDLYERIKNDVAEICVLDIDKADRMQTPTVSPSNDVKYNNLWQKWTLK